MPLLAQRVVIIGATSGLGWEMAHLFLQAGCRLGIAGRRNDRLEALQQTAPDRIVIQPMDITTPQAPQLILDLIGQLGGMDILVLTAGVGWQNTDLILATEELTGQTNTLGFMRVVNTAFNYFRQHQQPGHIAVISSIAGTQGLGVAPAYSATKKFQSTYLDALDQLARMEKRPIRFTDIRPGFVATDMLNGTHHYPMMLQAPKVARLVVRAIAHKKRVAILDYRYALLVFLWRLVPRWLWVRLPIRSH